MIDYDPSISVLAIVKRSKQMSTFRIWEIFDLGNYFWKEKTFWSDGYFVCSIGDASINTIKNYIQTQG